jgi:hypothetical protein
VIKRALIAIVGSCVCGWAIWQAARTGAARAAAESAELTGEISVADRAIRFGPNDAEAHFARGQALQGKDDFAAAALEFEHAVRLRPRDYFLWLMLGVTRDENQDQEGALRALRQAVKLAPAYAPPHWQLGNLLLRMGSSDDAFTELRLAASANPNLWPNVIDLAWGIYQGDPSAVIAVTRPQTDRARLELAIFMARHGQPAVALNQFRQTAISAGAQSEMLISELLQTKAFNEAYEVWAVTRGLSGSSPANAVSLIRNSGFEGPIVIDQAGFDWKTASNTPTLAMSIDVNQPYSGARSLRIEWRGDSDPTNPLLTQLVLVQRQSHYRLKFAVRSREFVSASSPEITIKDASDLQEKILAQSGPLTSEQTGWREITLDFVTGPQTEAITVSLSRQGCAQSPCPAFGVLWLDSFSIQ